jgi:lysyl-tRNA synthetase class 2
MFHAQKASAQIGSSLLQKKLQARAKLYQTIRRFFEKRSVLEVETHLLVSDRIPEPHIQVFRIQNDTDLKSNINLYLQASPELLMKQLLAQGSGDIFQISKAFRANEYGARHRPEFSLLEWYRVGWTEQQLRVEISELLENVLGCSPAQSMTYRQLFLKYLNLDIQNAKISDFQGYAKNQNHKIQSSDTWLLSDWQDYFWTQAIEPKLGLNSPLFVTEYPTSQAALAELKENTDSNNLKSFVAARFELYYQGLELANGYQELTDLNQLNLRYIEQGLIFPEYAKKHWQGLPACSGVALGLDRILMLQQKIKNIQDV